MRQGRAQALGHFGTAASQKWRSAAAAAASDLAAPVAAAASGPKAAAVAGLPSNPAASRKALPLPAQVMVSQDWLPQRLARLAAWQRQQRHPWTLLVAQQQRSGQVGPPQVSLALVQAAVRCH